MTDGIIVGLVVTIILNFIVNIVSTQSSETCPSFCVCDTWYMLRRASCTGRHLYNVYTGAPNTVQALDLSDNVISFLNNFELANAGLTSLKYLNLSGNTISEIGLNAFDNLNDLKVLDLSKNHLYDIPDDVFLQNKNLRILKLSRNNFNLHPPKFRSPWLTELSLDSCQISHLPMDTFNGLPRIQRLDLSNNLMIQMSSAIVQTLQRLKKLSLTGNPWSCNEIMHDLQIHLKHKEVKFDEVCFKKMYPKKFEKMILSPIKKQANDHSWSIIRNTTIEKTKPVTYNTSSSLNNKRLSTNKHIANQQIINVFLFLIIGFISGVACGMFISYFWFSGKYICIRYRRRDSNLSFEYQRHSLLMNPYLRNSMESDTSLAEPSPSTPPPSYREVVSRPSLYRCL
ncbi:leucine-rich repeat transmembrane protein FLRT3-like [Hylaeus volcanicus]|uniref:leucine-rich repeat transmembrane protein FLRT3-like n=1 Tax=Hylaeus volcanicus TaxID=313075 RepID=UPI0023B86ADC|nr:leucine-rich repeat transmembrane protein FLRT3-like [Hylaeus volcanicus]